MTYKKKLIEVALPLEAINRASAREKSIRHGHPSTLHLWWARRPLAAARAVIFAQMVDDPSAHPDIFKTEKAQEKERQRLFKIIEDLVLWENTTNEEVLQRARDEMWQSWRATCAENADHPRAKELFDRHKLPAFHDPFAGGGALPLEAQRLGLEAYASDLNPVAVLICKAMIEIPPKFAGKPPVNPESRKKIGSQAGWKGAQGLAEDVRYYGKWMRAEAEKRIGHLYPKIEVTADVVKDRPDLKPYVGKKLTVIAWLWARTVKSPNPAFTNVSVPLVASFWLSTKEEKEIWVEPVIRVDKQSYDFVVRRGGTPELKETINRRGGVCLMSGAPIPFEHIRAEAKAGRMGARLMAIVAEINGRRLYLSPTEDAENVATKIEPNWKPDLEFFQEALGFRVGNYGVTRWSDLFTPRQLVTLTTFSDLVQEAHKKIKIDGQSNGGKDDGRGLESGGTNLSAYADSVAVYLGFAVDRFADYWSALNGWQAQNQQLSHTFARQALSMVWDYAEANPFTSKGGSFENLFAWTVQSIGNIGNWGAGVAMQGDAKTQTCSINKVVSTDPPYYDNIGYADLSDFFYVWLRNSLKGLFPGLFATVSAPKADELVATPARHGSRENAEQFFLDGMTDAMHRLAEQAHPAFPVTIYYAFKQSETENQLGTASTGWETFLDAVQKAGFAISGTWPLRTEMKQRTRGIGSNALASSIVLVCRPRAVTTPTSTRREFIAALKSELPAALAHLQRGNIAPVDLAQAAIGPGMAVYTRYGRVVDAEGKPLSVREALALINQTLDEALAEQESEFDPDSRWALTWFEQSGFTEGDYGVAEQLSKSKNTSVAGMVEADIVQSKGGKVRLLKPDELPKEWDPTSDHRLTVWEIVHHLIRALDKGEAAAAALVAKLGTKAELARELAYRLYTLCERNKRAQEALNYNALVQSWPEIIRLARERVTPQDAELF
jgi:putative DNA methylase